MGTLPVWAIVLTSATSGAVLGALAKGVADWLTESRRFKREDRQRSEAARRSAYAAFAHAAGLAAQELGAMGRAITEGGEDTDAHGVRWEDHEHEVFRLYSEIRYLACPEVVDAARLVGEALSNGGFDSGLVYAALAAFNRIGRRDLGLLALDE